MHRSIAVAASGALLGHSTQVLHLGQATVGRGHGNGGSFGATSDRSNAAARPISAARSTTPGYRRNRRACSAPERRCAPAAAGQPRVDLVEAPPRPHRGERRGQPALRRGCVVDVVGRHALDSLAVGDLDERIVAGGVERIAVIPQFHQHAVTPERVDEPEQLAASRRRTVGDQCSRDRSLAAPGEHPSVAASGVGHVGERETAGRPSRRRGARY